MTDRALTSHERNAGVPWDASYHHGLPPWDTGQPQPAIVRLAAENAFHGTVLDAGCGSGENALHIAARGLSVLGIDVAETAVAQAKDKAVARGIEAEFAVADAFRLADLGRTFDTILDCGLFHACDDQERRTYAASLADVTKPGAAVYILCFRPADGAGPHPVPREELEAPFADGWRLARIREDRIVAQFAPEGAPAWLATFERR
ncbi:class I SAM-dependent methyltransferase [Amycolatopsis jejuensis]|uniref:class I SAM-dependent methyltransferase n=1 Tax=Amycolatopsis jejuensis TaxID=330084 RepID=UPI000691C90A|nr:class I SAM-dependent methyltransferase [Amycolatopsis jejuensis]